MGIIKKLEQELIENHIYDESMNGPEFDGPDDSTPKELLDAEERCPEIKFVQSCRAFFEKRGFLSVAQKRALTFSGTPNRRSRQFGWESPDDDSPF